MGNEMMRNWKASGRGELLYFDPEQLVLVEDKAHPLFDPRVHLAIKAERVEHVKRFGIQTPIEVIRTDEGEILVAKGRQRVKWLREANRLRQKEGLDPFTVPAKPHKATTPEEIRLLRQSIDAENAVREQDDTMTTARKMKVWDSEGMPLPDIAALFGCSAQTVRNNLALLDVTPAVQKAIEEGKVTGRVARELKGMDPEDQKAELEKLLADGKGGHGAAAEDRARRAREAKPAKPKAKAASKPGKRAGKAKPDKPRVKRKRKLVARPVMETALRKMKSEDWKGPNVCIAMMKHLLGHPEALEGYSYLRHAFGVEEG